MFTKPQMQLSLMLSIFVFVISAVAVNAQATRTWVSGVGDDVNPCSRTAPCKTFAGAISKTATNGEINCLDPAGYGSVTITKSITIDCEDTQGSILASLTTGVIINITADTDTKKAVKLRGLSINGSGNGINGARIIAANMVVFENMVIDGFTQHGISVENTGDVRVMVNNTSIRSNVGSGINGLPAGNADIMVANSFLNGNGTGISAGANSLFRLSGNTITHNTTGLAASHGKIFSFKNNAIDGNGTNGAPTATVVLQ